MIKVLVLTTYFYPDTGGVANHTLNLYSRMAKGSKFKFRIVAGAKKRSNEIIKGLKVDRLPYWFKVSNTPVNLNWYWEIKKIKNSFKPDIMAVHTPVPFMSDLGALLAGNIPLVVKYHHAGSMHKGKFLPDLLIKAYESTVYKYVMAKAKYILSASDFTLRTFLKDYKDKAITITPGVDTKRFFPVKFKDKNKIFFLGSLNKAERYKGLEYLIKAMPLVKKKIKNAKLIVVSPGDFKYYYEDLAKKLKVDGEVIFRGKVIGDDLVKELQGSSVVVLPSVFDSCPNILLEAMACGKPIVGSNVSGIPDLVTDGYNGFLTDPLNPEEIADRTIKILSDKKLARKMGLNGLERVRKQYTWTKKAQQTKSVFLKALKKS